MSVLVGITIYAAHDSNLSCTVNVGLIRILPLAEHGCRHHLVAIGPSDQGCGSIEDRGSVMQGSLAPCLLRLECAVDSLLHEVWCGMGVLGERIFVVEGAFLDLIGFSRNLPYLSNGLYECPRASALHLRH